MELPDCERCRTDQYVFHQMVEQYIFQMSDEEFDKVFSDGLID
jgi:hypothetical protein